MYSLINQINKEKLIQLYYTHYKLDLDYLNERLEKMFQTYAIKTSSCIHFYDTLKPKKLFYRFDKIYPLKNMIEINDNYYYNASLIPTQYYTYYASQCPIYNMFNDIDCPLFIKMIYDNDIKIISIPTNLSEIDEGKNYQWFPTEKLEYKTYRLKTNKNLKDYDINFSLKCKDIDYISFGDCFEKIKIIKLLLIDNITKINKSIVIYQYINWLENQFPLNQSLLIEYITLIYNHLNKIDNKKILIHCNAGIGRTGTVICALELFNYINEHFININTKKIINKITDDNLLELYNFIICKIIFLREYRPMMVENVIQFLGLIDLCNYFYSLK